MSVTLTRHDLNVLEKIKDPEANSSSPIITDSSLPRDPHITDPEIYTSLVQQEKDSIKLMISQPLPPTASSFKVPLEILDKIIKQYPDYASARNNRAQALRMLSGDDVLVIENSKVDSDSIPIHKNAEMILNDLSMAISLLSPPSPYIPIHPTSAKTLSQAYSQRGAIYLSAANAISSSSSTTKKEICLNQNHPEASWGEIEFREAASRDFLMGGKYGNPIAKALAVATNPTAKLCGEMVREAMRREYGQ